VKSLAIVTLILMFTETALAQQSQANCKDVLAEYAFTLPSRDMRSVGVEKYKRARRLLLLKSVRMIP
jgi:hypothetical protein